MTRKLWYAVPFALVVALVLGRAAYALVFGAATPLPLTLTPDRTSVSVPTGGHVAVGVQVHFKGSAAVKFTASGMPSPMTMRSYSAAQSSGSFTAIDFAVPLRTALGSYKVTVTGSAGRSVARFSVTVTVTPHGAFTMRLAPPERHAGVPGAANFLIRLDGYQPVAGRKIALSVHGLPAGTSATLSARTVSRSAWVTMHLSFARTTKPGVYRIAVIGRAAGETETAAGYLVLSAVPPTRSSQSNFIITGSATQPLAPGITRPLDVSITNTASAPLSVMALTVTVSGTSNPACSTSNYSIAQFGGDLPLQIPTDGTRTLSQLGIPQSDWPQITMLDLPVNQDACKGATLTLTYAGAGQGQ